MIATTDGAPLAGMADDDEDNATDDEEGDGGVEWGRRTRTLGRGRVGSGCG